ncbi:MAG: argininosuccinate lyase [Clostridia bacterium]|nr:argininosuccinate lyase [Clostridia bacterium]
MAKMWDGRFSTSTHVLMEQFNSSIQVDKRLVFHDIKGSVAHVKMLCRIGLLTVQEKNDLIEGLKAVEEDFKNGGVVLTDALEDIHMAVETFLTEKVGDVGKKLHTGRSRNDQVALDMRFFTKDAVEETKALVKDLIEELLAISKVSIDVIMPGFTHLQKAQPIRLSYHLMAYIEKFKRDYHRLDDALARMDESPLGVGAFAGVNYPSDRFFIQEELGFAGVCMNGMDAVSDRDYLLEVMSAFAIVMTHLSRLAEEIIIWSSNDFSYISVGDDFSTGSSIMPQKKNPDAAELIRGKTGRVTGQLMTLLTVMKGLPLAYNKDMQEDKEAFFDSLDTTQMSLKVMTEMLKTTTFNQEKMLQATKDGFLNATDLADYLVSKGLPFREAHKVVGSLVKACIDAGTDLESLSKGVYEAHDIEVNDALYKVLKIENCVESKVSYGGTSKGSVLHMIEQIDLWLGLELIKA